MEFREPGGLIPSKEIEPGQNAIAVVPVTRALVLEDALKNAADQRTLITRYVKDAMVRDVDFGVSPGTQKPTLYKPGAEKLTELFRCTPDFEITFRIVDYEKHLYHYEVKASLSSRDSGHVLGQGLGACSSMEGRYRWRKQARKCPSCGHETIIRGKKFDGTVGDPGWVCWAPKDAAVKACKTKFDVNDKAITEQVVGRVENPDIDDCVNTCLKIAKKRAFVDAALALGGISDMFTQDIGDPENIKEDPEEKDVTPAPEVQKAPGQFVETPQAREARERYEKTSGKKAAVTSGLPFNPNK